MIGASPFLRRGGAGAPVLPARLVRRRRHQRPSNHVHHADGIAPINPSALPRRHHGRACRRVMLSSSAFVNRILVAPSRSSPLALGAARLAFSTASPGASSGATTSSSSSKLFNAVAVLLTAAVVLSDPATTVIESMGSDENDSYWMELRKKKHGVVEEGGGGSKSGSARLRNAHNHRGHVGGSEGELPEYSRIVIVGGGMAGLHAALALAERMADPSSSRGANPPPLPKKQSKNDNPHRASREIIVLDASRVGNGASGRAKGLVVPGFQVPLEDLRANAIDAPPGSSPSLPSIVQSIAGRLGLGGEESRPGYTVAVVEEMYDLSYAALDRLRDVVEKYGIDCDWVESGAVEGSIHPMDDDEEDGDESEEDDGCRTLTSEQVNAMMGRSNDRGGSADLYKWGEYDPSCAGVNPLELTLGLADAAESWGVRIYEHARVEGLERRRAAASGADEGRYQIAVGGGRTVRCDHVVLCTGAEAMPTSVSRRLSNSFVPIHTWMAATEPLREECPLRDGVADEVLGSDAGGREGKPKPAPMCGDDHISLNYWRNDNKPDVGRLLFGSIADTYSFPKWLISWRLRSALSEVYPHLGNARFDHVWGGKLAFSLNSMPLIGRDTDYDERGSDHPGEDDVTAGGVWYLLGFAGHGIVPTCLAGSLVADAILGVPDRQQWRLFHSHLPPSPWNGYPASRMGGGAVLAVYNAWDYLGKKGVPLPSLPTLW